MYVRFLLLRLTSSYVALLRQSPLEAFTIRLYLRGPAATCALAYL